MPVVRKIGDKAVSVLPLLRRKNGRRWRGWLIISNGTRFVGRARNPGVSAPDEAVRFRIFQPPTFPRFGMDIGVIMDVEYVAPTVEFLCFIKTKIIIAE